MERILLFLILSLPVIALSWKTLFALKSHGFYRFFSWELIIVLFVVNYRSWFDDPFSVLHIISWVFLVCSGYLVIAGVILMKKKGKPGRERDDQMLYHFEKTSELVDTGIFKYIRHPLYSSLLFLTWGIYLKDPSGYLVVVAVLSTIALYLTARADEKECSEHFGAKYLDYMKRSKMFIPFIL